MQSKSFKTQLIIIMLVIFGGVLFGKPLVDTVRVSGIITHDTTWTANKLVLVVGDVTIPANITLTIQAGTVIKFTYYSGSDRLNLYVSGILNVQGTAANPVYFTSSRDDSIGGVFDLTDANPAPGDWENIMFYNGNNVFRHCVVKYGGDYDASGNAGMVTGWDCSPTIDSNYFAYSSYPAVKVRYFPSSPITAPGVRDNVILGCSYGIEYIGNSSVTIRIERNDISRSTSDQYSYGIRCQDIGSGSVIADDSIRNTNTGIIVEGSAPTISGNKIGADSYIGNKYSGIRTSGGVVSGNRVEGYYYGVTVTNSNPAITGNTFVSRNVWCYPFYLNSGFPTFSGNVFIDSCYHALAASGDIALDGVWDGLVQGDTWPYVAIGNIGIPSGRTLTIQAGTVIKFTYYSGSDRLNLYVSGILNVQGTAANPVYFTSSRDDSIGGVFDLTDANPAPGDWENIMFYNGNNVFRHCVVKYGGDYDASGNAGMVTGWDCSPTIDSNYFAYSSYPAVKVRYFPSSPVTVPKIRNNIINNCPYGICYVSNGLASIDLRNNRLTGTGNTSWGYGIYLENVGTGSLIYCDSVSRFYRGIEFVNCSPMVSYNTALSNVFGLYCHSSTDPIFHHNGMSGNSRYGLFNESTTDTVNARYN